MAIEKPQNHVTRALAEAHRLQRPAINGIPDIPEDLVAWLEEQYPPLCYNHRADTLEDHIKYSGMVELIAVIRLQFEEQKKAAGELEEDT